MKKNIFVVSEIACSHNGNKYLLDKLISQSYRAGSDSVQFQIWEAKKLAAKNSSYYTKLKKLEISIKSWNKIINLTKKKFPRLKIICCISDVGTLELLDRKKIYGYKIHSSDLDNFPLLEKIKKENKFVHLCTGGRTDNEINRALTKLDKKKVVLMHGLQLFPTPDDGAYLDRIKQLKKKFKVIVGYQDHSDPKSLQSYLIPILSVTHGAKVIEKHMTDFRYKKRTDYESAFEEKEFKKFVNILRNIELYSSGNTKQYKKYFLKYRKYSIKIFVASKNIREGENISLKNCQLKKIFHSDGVESKNFYKIKNKIAKKKILKDQVINLDLLR